MSHPELEAAIIEYIDARRTAEVEFQRVLKDDPANAMLAYKAIEHPAWEKFFEIKQRYWQLDHPE